MSKMSKKCIEVVQTAIGRSLNNGEAQGIESRIYRNARQLAQRDPEGWRQLTSEQKHQQAAQAAGAEFIADAALKKRRAALAVLAKSKATAHIKSKSTDDWKTSFNALRSLVTKDGSGTSGVQSVESLSAAIRDTYLSEMLNVIDATKGKFFGLFADKQQTHDFVRELMHQDSGNPVAKAAAKEFHAVAESARQRFNRSGGDVGHLDNYDMPHSHSQVKVARAGGFKDSKRAQETWVNDMMGFIDRSKYYTESGIRMNDAEIRDLLGHAWRSIATDGLNKVEAGESAGFGMRANRGNKSRQIHFKDAESYIAYQNKYGDTDLMSTIFGHIDRMSRDIALIETFGPNPHHMFKTLSDELKLKVANDFATEKSAAEALQKDLEKRYNMVAGVVEMPVKEWLANGFDIYRNTNVMAKLGSTIVTALNDAATMTMISHLNKLPIMQVFAAQIKTMAPGSREMQRAALRQGLGWDVMISSLNRFGSDGLNTAADTSSKMVKWSRAGANAIMTIQGLNRWTRSARQAVGAVAQDVLGKLSRDFDDMANLDAADRARLEGHGITPVDWAIWHAADIDDVRGYGDTLLTPLNVKAVSDDVIKSALERHGEQVNDFTIQQARDGAVARLLGYVNDEARMAVLEPNANTRADMQTSRGTWKGEIGRSMLQFKSFTWALMTQHGQRAMAQHGYGKAQYVASLVALTTIMGGISLQLGAIAVGKDPMDMTDDGLLGVPGLRFGLAAMQKGGGLGIFGDFLFNNWSQFGTSAAGVLGGPIYGDFEQALKIVLGGAWQAAEGDKVRSGAEAVKLLKSHTPFANLIYTRAVTDHLIFNQLMELASPGYLSNMRRRAARDYGTSHFWEPQDVVPYRMPDLDKAIGE